MAKFCESGCGSAIVAKYGRFCDPCRSQRRRKKVLYAPSAEIDALIRESYSKTFTHGKAPWSARVAARIRWPKWAVTKRACALGLARTKEKPWTEAELRIVEKFAWMSDGRIRQKLQAAGFSRTETAIHLKIRRMRFKQNHPYYTANGLAQAFGIDSHIVLRWITSGNLPAKHRGSERVPSQRGDIWMIHENDIYRFVRTNPSLFDIRKVDQVWFMDLVFQGKTGNSYGVEKISA